jgi:hypothetical protein
MKDHNSRGAEKQRFGIFGSFTLINRKKRQKAIG